MADAKALFTQRFDAARTALTKGDDPAAAESLHSAIVVARSDPNLRRELASALFHLGKLSRKFGKAGEAEAEPLLTEALTISEQLFGREHAALAPLLNELGRLYIHRSQFPGAAGVLERLLAIARAKGDETADVATALAGLAVVKRKLGDDASAEALYRDALRIQEKVLEPNHMVTVVTLEHLSETCAARGNFADALALLRRALATREVALGPGHATVQAARSRAAELELRVAVAADTAAKAARAATPTPAWLKRVPEYPTPREHAKTPTVTAAVAAASLTAPSIRMPAAPQIVISPPAPVSAQPSESVSVREFAASPGDAVLTAVAHSDAVGDDAALVDSQSTIARVRAGLFALAGKKRMAVYASVGVAAVAITGLLIARPRASGASAQASGQKVAAQRPTSTDSSVVTAPLTKTGSTTTGAAAAMDAKGADSLVSARATPTPTPTPPVAQAEKSAPENAPPQLRAPRVDLHVRPINLPSVRLPTISTAPSADSTARSSTERPRVSDTGRTGTADRVSAPASAEVDKPDVEKAIIPARIIGRPPAPRFPEALRSRQREGQVIVRFIVDEFGRVDVASMIVEQSDHDLFTAAVRDILPLFRFEPARTKGPESKPVAGWVSVPFRFTTNR